MGSAHPFLIRIAATGSIGPTSCHFSIDLDSTISSWQPWLQSIVQCFISTAWQYVKRIAFWLQPITSANRRQEQRLPCSS